MINKINSSTSFRGDSFIAFNDGFVNTDHIVDCDYDKPNRQLTMRLTSKRAIVFNNITDPKKVVDKLTKALADSGNKVSYIA